MPQTSILDLTIGLVFETGLPPGQHSWSVSSRLRSFQVEKMPLSRACHRLRSKVLPCDITVTVQQI